MADAGGKPGLLRRQIRIFQRDRNRRGPDHFAGRRRVMRARPSQDCSVFWSSPLTTKSACGAREACGAACGAVTRIFSIFAKPSARRVVTFAAIAATSSSPPATAIGITATVGTCRPNMKPGLNIIATTRQRRRRRRAPRRRTPRDGAGRTAATVAPAPASCWPRLPGRQPASGVSVSVVGGVARNLGREQIATAGDELDQLTLIVAERGPELPDALKQAVVADMDVRPDRIHQFLLAQHAPGVGRRAARRIPSVFGRSLMASPSGPRSSARCRSSSKPAKRSTMPAEDPGNVSSSGNIRIISERHGSRL